jgi:hypothetical protein
MKAPSSPKDHKNKTHFLVWLITWLITPFVIVGILKLLNFLDGAP